MDAAEKQDVQSEVARYFGRDAATVRTLISRLAERLAGNDELRREIEGLNKKVEK